MAELVMENVARRHVTNYLKTRNWLLEKDLSNDFQRRARERSRSRSASPMDRAITKRVFKPVFDSVGGAKKVLGDIGFSNFATSNQNNWDEPALRRVFNSIDTDGNNSLDIKELKAAFEKTNTHLTKD